MRVRAVSKLRSFVNPDSCRGEKDLQEFDFASNIISEISLDQFVTDFENRKSGVDVKDLTTCPGVDSLEEGLEASLVEVLSFSV